LKHEFERAEAVLKQFFAPQLVELALPDTHLLFAQILYRTLRRIGRILMLHGASRQECREDLERLRRKPKPTAVQRVDQQAMRAICVGIEDTIRRKAV
jgi:hypothetical protein